MMVSNDSGTEPHAGYREIEHTADWELEIWAPDLLGLLKQAALGMYALAGISLQDQPRVSRAVVINAHDAQELLVSFLSELLFIGENEKLGFDQMQLVLENNSLRADLSGAPISSMHKEIKAVTYHNLKVTQSFKGLATRVVFDV